MERRTYRSVTEKIIKSSRVLSVVIVSALNLPQIPPGDISEEIVQGKIHVVTQNYEFPKYPKLQAILPELNNLSSEARRRQSSRVK